MPIAESPSYHGYDVMDYRADRARLRHVGGLRGLPRRGPRARHQGHRGPRPEPHLERAPVVRGRADAGLEARRLVRLVRRRTRPGSGPAGQVVWHPDGERWYYGVFSEDMPDLNLRNPDVTAELEDVARFWLEDVGVDGFRLDAAKHLIEDGKDARRTRRRRRRGWPASRTRCDAVEPGRAARRRGLRPGLDRRRRTSRTAWTSRFDFGLATGIRLALQNGRAAPLETALARHAGRLAGEPATRRS